jgi:glycosyltransferase involved in cell wall biosynthesis
MPAGAEETKSPARKPKIVIVMPAYNAELTLEKTYYALPEGSYDQIILVDDASSDTLEVASKLDIQAIRHRKKPRLWRQSENLLCQGAGRRHGNRCDVAS